MTWTQNGIDYACQKYGDINECVVSSGLVFSYTDIQGQTYTGVTGGTADIVGFISFGLVQSITMTNPSRPTITEPQTELNNANGGMVTSADAQELTNHDENSGDQWCYTESVICEQHATQQLCEEADCYWYKKWLWEEAKCYSSPHDAMTEYLIYAGIGAAVLGGIILAMRRR